MGITRTDHLILTAIIRDVEMVKKNNIYELSNILYVSTSSITKACKKFGYEGYKDMQHRMKWEGEYKLKNIIRLIIEVNKALVYEPLLNTSNWREWQKETFNIIYVICSEVSSLSENQLQKIVVSCLAKMLFYLMEDSTLNNFLINRSKAVSELRAQGLLM